MEIIKSAITRANDDNPQLTANVAEIIARVRREGDAALVDYNTRFDGNSRKDLQVTRQEIDEAYAQLSQHCLHSFFTRPASGVTYTVRWCA